MDNLWMTTEPKELKEKLVSWRRDFHKYAEDGWLEMRTTSKIARVLTDLGYSVKLGKDVCLDSARMGLPSDEVLEEHYQWAAENGADPEFLPYTKGGFTGAIAELDCGEGPTLAMRFDIDAMGVLESNDDVHAPFAGGYRSVTEGIMHACGHDGHATIGLGVATLLMKHRDEFHGKIRLIFQPAEEGVRGARSIAEAGYLDDADFCIGSHIFPAPPKALAAGIPYCVTADGASGGLATTKIDVYYTGRSAHAGGNPQDGHNAMLSAATAVLNIHAIPRYGNTPTQINVGKLVAGTGRNVVCENAKLDVEVRGGDSESNEYLEKYVLQICKAAAEMHGCTMDYKLMGSSAALENSPELAKQVKEVMGAQGMTVFTAPQMGGGSEDYAYFSKATMGHGGKSIFVGLLTKCPAPNHNRCFDFDEDVLVNGVRLFCSMASDILK